MSEQVAATPVTIPKLLDGAGPARPYKPAAGAIVNVGDLVAVLGDGSACPASAWPRTGDTAADRQAFAATFAGCSQTHTDPTRPRHGTGPVQRIEVVSGGGWAFVVKGAVKPGDKLGPVIGSSGNLSPSALERVERAGEAVAEAVAQEGAAGVWRVRLYDRPGGFTDKPVSDPVKPTARVAKPR